MSRNHLFPRTPLLGILLPGVLFLVAITAPTWARPEDRSQAAPASSKKEVNATHGAQPQDEGERVFQQNCSRCHTAPNGFSPRISGTIVRHMRVRASLSQHDEEALLRFLNP